MVRCLMGWGCFGSTRFKAVLSVVYRRGFVANTSGSALHCNFSVEEQSYARDAWVLRSSDRRSQPCVK
jgi:hypothetical protein